MPIGRPGQLGALVPGLVRYRYLLATAAGLALDSIRAHKLRSFLTLLGVIIGVASVVIVGAAIEGLGVYAEESTAKIFGSETFLVSQVGSAVGRKEYFDKLRRNKPLRVDDLRYLMATTGDQVLYSAYNMRGQDVRGRDQTFESAAITGVSAVLPEMREVSLAEGRFFTDQEERSKQQVAVIGHDVRALLFPASSAAGGKIKIRGVEFSVVGVQEKLGSSFGRTQDNTVFIPFTVFSRLYGPGRSISVVGRARPETRLTPEQALDITRVALRTRFHTRPGGPDRFDAVTPEAIRSFIDQVLGMISAVVVPVTCLALVVGGIVIMNIMLVSVTERTHEIGIRMSLGARQADIRLQFLLEAVFLAAVGGVAGVLAGAGAAQVLTQIIQVSLKVTAPYVALALGVSTAVGVASGWYPAVRAARLDPIVALRSE